MGATASVIDWTERGWVPDSVVRAGIRRLLKARLGELHVTDCEQAAAAEQAFIRAMRTAPVAPVPEKANEQHYEVPAAFYRQVLGEHLKYSCCYWDDKTETLNQAEAAALALSCQRAQLGDGQDILELGCGWGSLTVWMAQHYPNSRITAVSNSASQKAFIGERLQRLGLRNVEIITADMNDFAINGGGQYDRVVSIEMFEHMRNYETLFESISQWLRPGGRFFMHIFCHRSVPYAFVERDETDWMSRYFFSGGMMPSDALPLQFQKHLDLAGKWRWDGRHYEKTANAWLACMDRNRESLWPEFEAIYGAEDAEKWWVRWRLFFMACAELFGFDEGQEWWVSHYLFEPK